MFHATVQGVIFGFKKNPDTLRFDALMTLRSPLGMAPALTRFGSTLSLSDSFVISGTPSYDNGKVSCRCLSSLSPLALAWSIRVLSVQGNRLQAVLSNHRVGTVPVAG